MLLEKKIDSKFEGNPRYEEYKRNTNVLVPWFKKEEGGGGARGKVEKRSKSRGASRGGSRGRKN